MHVCTQTPTTGGPDFAAEARDDADGERVVEAEGVPDGERGLAHLFFWLVWVWERVRVL